MIGQVDIFYAVITSTEKKLTASWDEITTYFSDNWIDDDNYSKHEGVLTIDEIEGEDEAERIESDLLAILKKNEKEGGE